MLTDRQVGSLLGLGTFLTSLGLFSTWRAYKNRRSLDKERRMLQNTPNMFGQVITFPVSAHDISRSVERTEEKINKVFQEPKREKSRSETVDESPQETAPKKEEPSHQESSQSPSLDDLLGLTEKTAGMFDWLFIEPWQAEPATDFWKVISWPGTIPMIVGGGILGYYGSGVIDRLFLNASLGEAKRREEEAKKRYKKQLSRLYVGPMLFKQSSLADLLGFIQGAAMGISLPVAMYFYNKGFLDYYSPQSGSEVFGGMYRKLRLAIEENEGKPITVRIPPDAGAVRSKRKKAEKEKKKAVRYG